MAEQIIGDYTRIYLGRGLSGEPVTPETDQIEMSVNLFDLGEELETAMRFPQHLLTGLLADRPDPAAVPPGTLYSADDGVIYQSDGAAWAEWAAGGSAPAKQLHATQYGPMPVSVGSTGMYRIPYADGAAVTYTLARASLHLETAGSTTTTLLIEKSSATGVFTPVLVATLTLVASATLVQVTTSLGTLASGNLLRYRWTALGTGAQSFHAQLEGTEI